jgi:RNA polymerase primary sigma factor
VVLVQEIQELLEKGKKQGYVTYDDILTALPKVEESLAEVEDIIFELQQQSIEILEAEGAVEAVLETQLAELEETQLTDLLAEESTGFDLTAVESDDPMTLYLREIGRYSLLTADDEVTLAKQRERGESALKQLEQGVDNPDTRDQLRQEAERGKQARDRLIQGNFRLVISIAKQYQGYGVPFLDLIQEGNLGLMRAIDKFDFRRGFKLSTYATWWIRQAVGRAVADYGRNIRLPVHMNERLRRLYRLSQRLEQELGRKPSTEELAEEMNIPAGKIQAMLGLSQDTLSLEMPVGEEQESELGQFIEDEISPAPDDRASHELLHEDVEEALETLSPRESRILRLRFGLHDGHSYTLEEVGRKFGLTRERVRQIEKHALRRLRHASRSRKLRGYL